MVSIRRRILHKGKLIKEQFIRTLQDHEDRLTALEEASDNNTESDNTNEQQEVTPTTRDLSFTITDGTNPIEGATVTVGTKTGTTGSAGGCTISSVAEGEISIEVSKEGYTTKTVTETVDSTHTSFSITLVAVSNP